MLSKTFAQMTQRILALLAVTATVLFFTTGNALAGHCSGVQTVTISAVSWDGNTLTVEGCVPPIQGKGQQDPVTVVDTANNAIVLGTDTPKKNGDWDISSAICAESVTANHTSGSDTFVNPDGCGGQVCTRNAPTFSMGQDRNIAADGNTSYPLSVTNNDTAACPDTTFNLAILSEVGDTGSFNASTLSALSVTVAPGAIDTNETLTVTGNGTGVSGDALTSTVEVRDDVDHAGQEQTDAVTTTIQAGVAPTARGDDYTTPRGRDLEVPANRLSGVLYNDFDPQDDPLTAIKITDPSHGTVSLASDGSFTYEPNAGFQGDDQFTYVAQDTANNQSDETIVNVRVVPNQPDFKFMMNYELGMHCTGFEFSYCCVLPAYNSIVAQVVKPQNGSDWPHLLEGDPNVGRNLDFAFNAIYDATNGGLDGRRETVVRDRELDANGNFKRYVVKYWHDAQSRNEQQIGSKPQSLNADLQAALNAAGAGYLNTETLISDVELHSLLTWTTRADAASELANDALDLGLSSPKGAAQQVVQGNGLYNDQDFVFSQVVGLPTLVDNYQNAVWNHLYIFFDPTGPDTEGTRLCVNDASVPCHDNDDCAGVGGLCGNSNEDTKMRLGLDVGYPVNFGPAGHPMGPVSGGVFNDNAFLTFSGHTGTVVYTQMKLVENLPVTLTSPDIWEALGLPLTPFEDTANFFADAGAVDEQSIRPYVQMTVQLHEADCDASGDCQAGNAVMASDGHPVQGFGTAPIDIPNCERCHSAFETANSPNGDPLVDPEAALVKLEIDFWNAYYDITTGDSDWYSRLKGAAISILETHDNQHGTGFLDAYPANPTTIPASNPFDPVNELGGLHEPLAAAPAFCVDPATKELTATACSTHATCVGAYGTGSVCDLPQNTRTGYESVICQKCHADNVIAVVKSAECGPGATSCNAGDLIPSLSDALHWNHRSVSEGGTIAFSDSHGRNGGCQGCHPAHRSDGVMDGYPITLDGDNEFKDGDNRLASGGCFVGRDVHSNPFKRDPGNLQTAGSTLNPVGTHLAGLVENSGDRGIWCTNCHNQLSQEIWKKENMVDLINNIPGKQADGTTDAVNLRTLSMANLATELGTTTAQIDSWLDPLGSDVLNQPGPGRAEDDTHRIWDPAQGDAMVAVVEAGANVGDDDLALALNVLSFCTTPDCLAAINEETVPGTYVTDGWPYQVNARIANGEGVAVPFNAATDGRDHWLSPGEPHCADCHAAPFTEPSGNHVPFTPFNYPQKASLMRYSRGHQDITCQGCHESIHGLYPVTPTIDNTSYAQAAALNHDGSHGPLKCGACHDVDNNGVPTWVKGVKRNAGLTYNGQEVDGDFDVAVAWAHTATPFYDPLQAGGTCNNCHTEKDDDPNDGQRWDVLTQTLSRKYAEHAKQGSVPRSTMDKVEIASFDHVAGDPEFVNPLAGTALFPGTQKGPGGEGLCVTCHTDNTDTLAQVGCSTRWKDHLIEGRTSEKVWTYVSEQIIGSAGGAPATDGTICNY